MNDEHLEQLISSHLHGLLTPIQREELEQRLLHSAADRERFWQVAETHAMLHEALQPDVGFASIVVPTKFNRFTRLIHLRPLTSAAAGVCVGLLCASLVFGYAIPRPIATVSRFLGLADGSFENTVGPISVGIPVNFGVWSGEEAETAPISEVESVDGKQVLRFIQAVRDPSQPTYRPGACDVYQLVDLHSLKDDISSGEATLELSASFLDARDVKGDQVKFIASLYVFSGTPEELPLELSITQKDALSSGSVFWRSSGGDPERWQQVTARALLPPEADFALVHLMLADRPVQRRSHPVRAFGKQFADDVRLTIKTQPALPVRTAVSQ